MRFKLTYVANMPGTLMTAEEFSRSSFPNKRVELVRGRLVVREPPGYRHAAVTAQITGALLNHAAERKLGQVLAGDPGFTLFRNPDTVRGPEVAFIARNRVPRPIPSAFAELAPDLAVEILSPGDRAGETRAKVADWLNAGTRLVWVIDPVRGHARVYRQDGTSATVLMAGVLEGEDVLPEFRCRLEEILQDF